MFSITIIPDRFIQDNKVPIYSNGLATEVESMSALAEIATAFHFSPGTFAEDMRGNNNLKAIRLISFDFDDGSSVESVIKKVGHWKHLIAASKNHLVDKHNGRGIVPRFHLFLYWQSGTITSSAEFTAIVKATRGHLQLTDCDKSICDAARYFYRHREILSVKDTQTTAEAVRQRFDESEIKHATEKVYRPERIYHYRQSTSNLSALDKVKRSQRYYDLLTSGLNSPGSRHGNCLKVLGAMKTMGIDRGDARNLIIDHAGLDGSFTTQEIDQCVGYVFK